jgi:hypothetical protein
VDAAATELARVVRPGGACYLLEPVRPQGWRGRLADLLSLVAGALCRVYVNHDVARTLDAAGLHIERRTRVWSDVVVVLVGRSRRRDEPLPPDTCGDAARRALPRATSVAASAPAATVGPSLLFPE